MSPDKKSILNSPIYEQAAEWLIELREGEIDEPLRERLDAWFRESPQHIRAYLELSAVWEDGADPDLDRAHNTEELIALARSTNNVFPIKGIEPGGGAATAPLERAADDTDTGSAIPVQSEALQVSGDLEPIRRHFWRPAWVAGLVLTCVVGGGGLYVYSQRDLTFATQTGEQRFAKLADGSTLELNSRSRVRIRFSEHERDVDLLEGQALFHVAKDATRPFVVHSDATQVRAVGTEFDVYRKDSGTVVTVVEGRVAVLSPLLGQRNASAAENLDQSSKAAQQALRTQALRRSAKANADSAAQGPATSLPDPAVLSSDHNAIFLDAGEQLTVSFQVPAHPTHTDPVAATAWTQHEIVFDSTPLKDVATEFNRYNTRPLIISDEAVRNIQITGVFSSADAAPLLKFLRAQQDITVQETDEDIRILKK
jgi:transmembrane sensor